MARIVIEDAVLFLMSFYLLTSIIFGMGLFTSFAPSGMQYNMTTNSYQPVTTPVAISIFVNNTDFNSSLAQYNDLSVIDPGAMLNPIAVCSISRIIYRNAY